MTMTDTTLKFLRPQITRDFDTNEVEIERVLRSDDRTYRTHFIDRVSREVFSKYLDHPRLKPLTNSDGRTIYCPPELHDFALQVREVMPYVDFYIENIAHNFERQEYEVEVLHVHRPGDVKTMGMIGYGHTGNFSGRRRNSHSAPQNNYLVYTPYIQNNKYREGSSAYFMKATKSVTTAMKNVKKFLRPWSPVDIAYSYRTKFEAKVQRKINSLSSSTHKLEYSLDKHLGDMAQLIRDLVDKKTDTIMDANLQDKIEKFLAEKEALAQEVSKSLVSTFVLVRPDNTVDTLMFGADAMDKDITCTSTATKTYPSVDDLPDELQGAISVMSILDGNEYVEDVGMKINDRTYWVHHEDN